MISVLEYPVIAMTHRHRFARRPVGDHIDTMWGVGRQDWNIESQGVEKTDIFL